ncbi:MAG TPA: hypothetical protein VN822_11160 [Candidatus Acidoferrales bacterium]|nr:hypothetical protein [Candidatus Acidoferrales bacterium]
MVGIPAPLPYMLIACGITTIVLAILVIYGNALSTREEDQLYLNKAEQSMMASEQRVLVAKMNRLKKVIVVLAVISGILVLASTGTWLYLGLTR